MDMNRCRTTAQVWAPWWQVPPIDLVVALLPCTRRIITT